MSTQAQSLGRRRWLSLIALLLVTAGFSWIWHRSYRAADLLLFYDRSSRLYGMMSHRGAIVIGFSNLQVNPEKSLSVQHVTAEQAEGDWVYDMTFSSADKSHAAFGFGWSEGAVASNGGVPSGTSFDTLVIPHLAISAVVWLLLARHLWRHTLRITERRRRRRGECPGCGYDLRLAVADRCPECGGLVAV